MLSKLRVQIPSETAMNVPEAATVDPTDGTGVFLHRFEDPSYWILGAREISSHIEAGK